MWCVPGSRGRGVSVALLEFDHIGKSFFGVRVLGGVSLSLEAGQVLGLIGENGAGKSTLMNILGGVVQPDEGSMRLGGASYAPKNPREAGRQGIGFIHQELNLFLNLSIAENLFIDRFPAGFGFVRQGQIRRQARELLRAVNLDLSPDLRLEQLSPGERQLVEIAKALGQEARILIFDEPTTSLTARETEKLFGLIARLRSEGKAVIYISHILGDVKRLCDTLLILRDGQGVGGGKVADFDVPRMISLMVGRKLEQLYPPRTAQPTEEVVLEAQEVSQRGVVESVNLRLHRGEVLGIFGLMGSGRSELARILFGLDPFERGSVRLLGQPLKEHTPQARVAQGMAFVTENRREEGLLMEAPILDNLGLVALTRYAAPGGVVQGGRLLGAASEVGRSLRLKADNLPRQRVRSLSGGNQQKTVVGKWLLNQPQVFILDEPTRGVDVGAKYEIYSIIGDLAAKGAGVLVISSELEELLGICDRILVMANGEIRGGFSRDNFDRERILTAAFREEVTA